VWRSGSPSSSPPPLRSPCQVPERVGMYRHTHGAPVHGVPAWHVHRASGWHGGVYRLYAHLRYSLRWHIGVYRHPAHPPRARHLGLHPPLPLISPFRWLRGMADSAPRGALPHTPQTLSSLIHPPCSALLLSSHLPSGQVAERVSGCSNPCGTGPLSASPLTLASHLPSGRCLSAGG